MNLLRQREKLKEMAAAKAITPSALKDSLSCPVFYWDVEKFQQPSDEERKFAEELMIDPATGVPKVSPFHAFRIYDKDSFKQCFFIAEYNRWELAICLEKSDQIPIESWLIMKWPGSTAPINGQLFINGKPNNSPLGKTPQEIQQNATAVITPFLGNLECFLYDVMMPGNTILQVKPAPKGEPRSVEWTLARTHYLILHRKQAELCRDRKSGPSEQQLMRAAHWRRAHFRRLRSEKFTRKRGMLVPVKQSWVGPDEWTGLDGKIYKVVSLQQ